MSKLELLEEEIKTVLNDLSNTQIKNIDAQEFMGTFLNIFDVNDPDSYNIVTSGSYLVCVLLSSGLDINFDTLMSYLKDIDEFFHVCDVDEKTYRKYIISLKKLYDLNILNKITMSDKIKQFNKEEKDAYLAYKDVSKDLFTLEDEDSVSKYFSNADKAFINLFYELPVIDKFLSFFELNFILGKTTEMFEKRFNAQLIKYKNIKIKQKDKDKFFVKVFREALKYYSDDLSINNDYKMMVDYHSKIRKQVKEDVSSINKKIRKIDDFIFKLNYLDSKKIINLENYEQYLFDQRVRYRFIDFCIEHNLELCKDLEEKNKEYKNNEITKLELLFTKYGFNFNDLLEEEKDEIIKVSEIKDVESILAILKYSELNFLTEYHKEFTSLIIKSDVDIIKTIDCALKNKIIDKQTLIKHLEILFDKNKYNNFKDNINLLTLNDIDLINLLKINKEVLFFDNNSLTTNFNILDEYNFKLDNTNNYQILMDNNLLDIIDNFIELGLYKILKNNQKVLSNKCYDVVKRILICNLLDISSINSQERLIGQVTSGNKFYVANSNLGNYIINSESIYLNPNCVSILKNNNRNSISEEIKDNILIKQLDNLYRKDSLTYEINGVVISRNRVLRNFELLSNIDNVDPIDILYQSILYKIVGNIDDDKLIEIYNSLKNLNIEKEKNYIK